MAIETFIKTLEAVNDSLKSPTLRESDDFDKCMKRFQAKLADLKVVFKSANGEDTADLKASTLDLKVILE